MGYSHVQDAVQLQIAREAFRYVCHLVPLHPLRSPSRMQKNAGLLLLLGILREVKTTRMMNKTTKVLKAIIMKMTVALRTTNKTAEVLKAIITKTTVALRTVKMVARMVKVTVKMVKTLQNARSQLPRGVREWTSLLLPRWNGGRILSKTHICLDTASSSTQSGDLRFAWHVALVSLRMSSTVISSET